jgi:hypothetical protein
MLFLLETGEKNTYFMDEEKSVMDDIERAVTYYTLFHAQTQACAHRHAHDMHNEGKRHSMHIKGKKDSFLRLEERN